MAQKAVVITGDAELNRKLANLQTKFAKKAIRTAARESLKPLRDRTKRAAPVSAAGNTGKYPHPPGNLRRSVRVLALPRSRKWVGARVSSSEKKSLYRGQAFYGGFIEFGRLTGTRNSPIRYAIPANPFMGRTAKRYQRATIRLYQTHLARAIRALT